MRWKRGIETKVTKKRKSNERRYSPPERAESFHLKE
jgi:hypothetical protein